MPPLIPDEPAKPGSAPRCHRCGAALKDHGTADGLCSACLLEEGLGLASFGAADEPGRILGDYEILEAIARGGMGMVYKARQLSLGRIVALKTILAGSLARGDEVARFRREAEAAAHLKHPHIVAIHEVGECDGQHFFSMDFVEGQTLRQLTRDNPLPAQRAARYLRTIAEAVHYAHEQGIVHRDLKPSNVLIDVNDQPHVTDFGLAKRIGSDADITLSGAAMGTPGYMPPEQASGGSKAAGPQSDVYALGAMLYDLLTGRPPHRADTALETLAQTVREEPVAPRLLNPSIPRDLETICLKCLEKDPARRYAGAQALANDLARYLNHEPIHAVPPDVIDLAGKFVRRHRVAVAITAGLAVLLTAATVISTTFGIRANLERAKAKRAEGEAKSNEKLAEKSAAEARMILQFLNNHVLAAARPEGQDGGLGRDVTLRKAILAAEPKLSLLFSNQPGVEAEIRDTFGTTLFYLTDYTNAIVQSKRAFDLATVLLGESDIATITYGMNLAHGLHAAGRAVEEVQLSEQLLARLQSIPGASRGKTLRLMNHLAGAYHDAGQEAQASALWEKTIPLMKSELGPDDLDTLQCIHDHAVAELQAGRESNAIPILEQAYRAYSAKYGEDHLDALPYLNSLAAGYAKTGRAKAAIPLLERALQIDKAKLGPASHQTLVVMQNLAAAYRSDKRMSEALALLEQALELSRATRGSNHVNTISCMDSLAAAYSQSAQNDRAVALWEEALALCRSNLPPAHPDSLRIVANLGGAYSKLGRVPQAISLLEDAVKASRSSLGAGDHRTLNAMMNLANAYDTAERHAEALALQEESLKLSREALGSTSTTTYKAIVNLSVLYRRADRWSDAVPLLKEALAWELARYGPEDSGALKTMCTLAHTYLKLEQFANAQATLQTCLPILRRKLPEEEMTLNAQRLLMEALVAQGQFEEAERDLLAAYNSLTASHPRALAETAHRLVRLYEAWDKADEAAKWRRQSSR